METKQKIELLNKVSDYFERIKSRDYGSMPPEENTIRLLNSLFDSYLELVADAIDDTKDGIDWFVYNNECGNNKFECETTIRHRNGEVEIRKIVVDSPGKYVEFLES